jgi:hypothetical protein
MCGHAGRVNHTGRQASSGMHRRVGENTAAHTREARTSAGGLLRRETCSHGRAVEAPQGRVSERSDGEDQFIGQLTGSV